MSRFRNGLLALGLALATTSTIVPTQAAYAASAEELNADVQEALTKLYAESPKAREIGGKARAVLVFPKIVKAGFIIGGQGGEGVLFVNNQPAGYYKIAAGSVGLQAGGQTFGYALFFMNDAALAQINEQDGWSVGAGVNMVVLDAGGGTGADTTRSQEDIYAVPFDEKGFMAGIDIEGSRISRIEKK